MLCIVVSLATRGSRIEIVTVKIKSRNAFNKSSAKDALRCGSVSNSYRRGLKW
nr:MAG TPA: hypothetical protein [Caudoviricetes sp.]